MISTEKWVDLLDPTPDDVRAQLPDSIHDRALEQILAPSVHGDEPRPVLVSHGDYVFGLFLVPVVVEDEALLYYQEFDLVATADKLVTIRKTPSGGRPPFDVEPARTACSEH